MIKLDKVVKALESVKNGRSHWDKCVKSDAIDLINELISDGITEVENTTLLKKSLLNGAENWQHYSRIGNGLCYNYDLAKYYLTPSEFKKWENAKSGFWDELDLLEVQGRALYQANNLINMVIYENKLA